jgi:signal transduction histidine kinase
LIDDLLTLARGDAGARMPTEPVDLDDLVFEEVRAERSPSIELDVSRVSAAQVTANRDELRRVVRNLIDNARRHARRTVTIELHETDGWATLVVGDDGPGIPADRRADVFERFTRLDESRTGAGRAGLGLAIVRDIVTRHRGTVEIGESNAGGARVEVRLPCR